jgi:hypothetical protein
MLKVLDMMSKDTKEYNEDIGYNMVENILYYRYIFNQIKKHIEKGGNVR